MSYCCDNAQLARKQREEIILMTNELRNQEENLNQMHSAGLKQKEKFKNLENQLTNYQKTIKSLNTDISNLKDHTKNELQQTENLKQKMREKDLYIQSQVSKAIKLQASYDKTLQEFNLLKQNHNETKLENARLKEKSKEQASRILELKESHVQKNKLIETKNNLIQSSAEHITTLEQNLKRLIDFMDEVKDSKGKAKQSKEMDLDLDELSLKSSSSTNIWTIVEKPSESKLLDTANERQLNTILNSLKETWFESNLKYEEIRNLLTQKINESKLDLHSTTASEKTSNLTNISRMVTSSPINT